MGDFKPCRYCGAPVRWHKHARTRKPAPLDRLPDYERGNCLIVEDRDQVQEHGPMGSYVVLNQEERLRLRDEVSLYLPHHMTCPIKRQREHKGGQLRLLEPIATPIPRPMRLLEISTVDMPAVRADELDERLKQRRGR